MGNNNELMQLEAKKKMSGLWVKALVWFVLLMIIGGIVCIILGTLKVAIQAILTVAGILAVMIAVGVAAYYAIRYKYHADRYARSMRKED